MRREILERVLELRGAKHPFVLVTDLDSGAQQVIEPEGAGEERGELVALARRALREDRSGTQSVEGRNLFLQAFNPPLRMVIVGAVHIAQPLSRMAALAGFEVHLVDPRTAFGSDVRFPGVEIATDWPDEALRRLAPDRRTAVVTLTHDPKLDDPALAVALRSEVFYIGSLGSKRTHAKRLERLREEGFEEEALERIHGPIGLSIGARSPAEIAVSILAEVVARLRQAPA